MLVSNHQKLLIAHVEQQAAEFCPRYDRIKRMIQKEAF